MVTEGGEARGREGEARLRVVIVGGGIAGLEALLALRELAGDRVDITLVAPDPDFTYKPLAVEEPFTLQPAERRELEPAARELGARFVLGAVSAVLEGEHALELSDGSRLEYDRLIVAVGARQAAPYESGTTFRLTGEPLTIEELVPPADGEGPARVALVVPPGVAWSLPIYELALMARRRADETGREDVEYVIVTPEAAPMAIFGTAPSDAVADLLRARRIGFEGGAYVHEVDGRLIVTPGDRPLEATHVVSLPNLEGPGIAGLPADEGGFLPIDAHARVEGVEDVYAAGDGTTFPIKQGGIATQQADAAAEHIAASAGADVEPQPFRPVLRGQLITGGESLQMRHELTGGAGEGEAGSDYLWWPPHKVGGRHLAPWLGMSTPHAEFDSPPHWIEVEVSFPEEWHADPMALDPHGTPRID
jgi:sulfide:quinone oxidoreductase